MSKILDNKNLNDDVSLASLYKVIREFDYGVVAQKYIGLYKEIISS